ncbi:MAG: protease pro-enzyme activation domain-containing protein [Bryobacteraceae bacterium]
MTKLLLARIALLGAVLAAPSATLLAQQDRINGRFDTGGAVPLRESVARQAQPQFDRGAVEPSRMINGMTLLAKPSAKQQAELETLLAEQQNPASANYHKWLTPEQFGDRFGLSQNDVTRIVSWLQSQGFTVEETAHARNWLAFSGTAQQVSNAFRTEIHSYAVNGEMHFANATAPVIPAALKDIVGALRGLNDFYPKPMGHARRIGPVSSVPAFNIEGGHVLGPDDWATIYDVSALYANGIDGTGQKIAIIGGAKIDATDANAFRTFFNLPAPNVQIVKAGPDSRSVGDIEEANLDIQWSGAVARNATIVYVYAEGFYPAIQAAVDQNLAPVISMSFGGCELFDGSGYRFLGQQANAEGITMVASSGDSGAAGCDAFHQFGPAIAEYGLGVSFPASLPEVTAVGGTELFENGGPYWKTTNGPTGASALGYIPETSWNETAGTVNLPDNGILAASGGGVSILFSQPSWQTGPGVPNLGARLVPDIAFSSAAHDAYLAFSQGNLYGFEGTSASAPSFAGVVALLNQYLVSKGIQKQAGMGNINPELYRLAQSSPGVFHDVTTGSNIVPCAGGSPDCTNGFLGYSAGPGYDMVTGLGSVDAFSLVMQWNSPAAATTTSLVASPTTANWSGSAQFTATVTATNSLAPALGTVTFTSGANVLGTATLVAGTGNQATATLPVSALQLPAGNDTVTATYNGSAAFNVSSGSTTVTVVAPATGSAVAVSISPNPVAAGLPVLVTLTEEAGVATTVTGWNDAGSDLSFLIGPFFGTSSLPANGQLSVLLVLSSVDDGVWTFSGQDANGATWSQSVTVHVTDPLKQANLVLSTAPATVLQNPAAGAACQWPTLLTLQETAGYGVVLGGFQDAVTGLSADPQQIFGTYHIAGYGTLQALVCPSGVTPPMQATYTVGGTDSLGNQVSAMATASLAGPGQDAGTFEVTSREVDLSTWDQTRPVISSIGMFAHGAGSTWSASVFPANAATKWLTIGPASGTGLSQLNITASPMGMRQGVYNATILLQATNSFPQYIEIPVVFSIGVTGSARITSVLNGASFQPGAAPGMTMTVRGSNLSPYSDYPFGPPYLLADQGVSATVNGVGAPLFYIAPGRIDLQVPYETGAGPALLAVNNNGYIASYWFQVTPSAPGIFTDFLGNIQDAKGNPASGKLGDSLTLYITGDGDMQPPGIATGQSPSPGTPLAFLPLPALLPFTVTVGGVEAFTPFYGIPPGLVGETQVNFRIPATVPAGPQPVVVTVGNASSPPAMLTVLPAQ